MSLENAKKHAEALAQTCLMAPTTADLNSRMNELFGNPKGDPQNINWSVIERFAKMLNSEVKELTDAVAARDLQGILDGIGDVTTVNDGIAHALGTDGYEVFRKVLTSNLSKFCANEQEAADTVAKYAALGVSVEVFGTAPVMFVKSDRAQPFNGETIPAGKFLKGVNFQEPDFTALLRPFYPDLVDPAP